MLILVQLHRVLARMERANAAVHSSHRGEPVQAEIGGGAGNGARIPTRISAHIAEVSVTGGYYELFSTSLINTISPFLPRRSEIYMKCIHGTMVVWLQNNAGQQRWGPTESRVEALLEAFRPVRDKEREKQLAQALAIPAAAVAAAAAAAIASDAVVMPPMTPSAATTTSATAAGSAMVTATPTTPPNAPPPLTQQPLTGLTTLSLTQSTTTSVTTTTTSTSPTNVPTMLGDELSANTNNNTQQSQASVANVVTAGV